MGRFLLLLVAGVSVASATVLASSSRGTVQTAEREALSEEGLLARGAAQSGFDIVVRAVMDSYGARPQRSRAPIGSDFGTYDVTTTDSPRGNANILVRGHYGQEQYVMEGEVVELLPLGSAVVAHGEKIKMDIKESTVSGVDHRTPLGGVEEVGPAGTNTAIGYTDFGAIDEMKTDKSTITGPTQKVSTPDDITAIVDKAVEGATWQKEYKKEGGTVGSPTAPVIIHAKKIELKKGTVGYGLLVADEEIKIEDGVRWEGLIVVRAQSNKKGKVEIKDGSEIYGSVVLLGSETLEEQNDDPGFSGGHMDLDIFKGSGPELDREYHQHEWDDKNNLTTLNFFSAPDLAPDFAEFLADNPNRTLLVHFFNANNSTGTYKVESDGVLRSGNTEDGFTGLIKTSKLSQLEVSFGDALCALRGTSPGNVSSDHVNRDGAFTVRFYDTNLTTIIPDELIYSVSAYEHAKGNRETRCSTTTAGTTPEPKVALYGEFEFKMDDSDVVYSEEALGRLGSILPTARGYTRGLPMIMRSLPVTNTVFNKKGSGSSGRAGDAQTGGGGGPVGGN